MSETRTPDPNTEDLATLRSCAEGWQLTLLDRVEAVITRLTEDREQRMKGQFALQDEITRLTQERDDLQREAGALAKRMVAGERALAERMTKESGRALIEDANRWQKAYCEVRDQLVETREALEEIASRPLDEMVDDHTALSRFRIEVQDLARRTLARSVPQEPQS